MAYPYVTAVTFTNRDNGSYPVDAGVINSIQNAVADLSSNAALPTYQAIPYAATVTPNPALGTTIQVGNLTGAITIAAPTTNYAGQVIRIILTQDAVGGRVITWNAAYKDPVNPATTANLRKTFQFVYDGTVWTAI